MDSKSEPFLLILQYQLIDQSPIEGFFIYVKPYSSADGYTKETLLGGDMRQYHINGLMPHTEYSIMIRSFNAAGESEDSNVVVMKTLGELKHMHVKEKVF